jgi:predicted PurR-regulated permease PerM
MEILINFLKRPFVKRLLVLVVIGFLLYLVRKQLTLFLVTFILIYLIDTSLKFLMKKISKVVKLPRAIVLIFIYLVFLGFLFLVFYKFVPEIIREITDIVKSVIGYIAGYNFSAKTNSVILNYIFSYLGQLDIQQYIKQSGTVLLNVISNIGAASIDLILAIILSLFFMLEKDKIKKFYHGFKES